MGCFTSPIVLCISCLGGQPSFEFRMLIFHGGPLLCKELDDMDNFLPKLIGANEWSSKMPLGLRFKYVGDCIE